MKHYTYLFSLILLLFLCFGFTNLENSDNNANQNCQPVEELYVALNKSSSSLLFKWDDVKSDITYQFFINGMSFYTTDTYIEIPLTTQLKKQGVQVSVRKSCQNTESAVFFASLIMQCEGVAIEQRNGNSLKPANEDSGCCIIATSGNINVHGGCGFELGGEEEDLKFKPRVSISRN